MVGLSWKSYGKWSSLFWMKCWMRWYLQESLPFGVYLGFNITRQKRSLRGRASGGHRVRCFHLPISPASEALLPIRAISCGSFNVRTRYLLEVFLNYSELAPTRGISTEYFHVFFNSRTIFCQIAWQSKNVVWMFPSSSTVQCVCVFPSQCGVRPFWQMG